MLNRLTNSLSLLMLIVTVHGELAYTVTESSNENLKNLVVMVLVGVLFDWLRLKLNIPFPSTEKLGYGLAEKTTSVSEEETTPGFETPETRFDSSKQTHEEKEKTPENIIPPEEATQNFEEKKEVEEEEEKDKKCSSKLKTTKEQNAPVMLEDEEEKNEEGDLNQMEEEKIMLIASTFLSTHNVEPIIAPECTEEESADCVFEEFIANLTKPGTITRRRFNSDPTGRDDRWGTFDARDSKMIVGERSPERTPEMPITIASLSKVSELQEMKAEEIPDFQEPGSIHTEEWLLPEEKINERKPMVFIGGVSASTTPMEVVYELKKQNFNVTVVPRIRYGVSFGFCPDLVLSSDKEVETLLAMKKIWIKDRWVDVRPYVPKDEESNGSGNNSASSSIEVVQEQIYEVNANVFAETSDVSIASPTRSSPPMNSSMTPPMHHVSPDHHSFQGSPLMPIFNGYECAYVDMNMSPPGSLSSTPTTFIPSHAIPAQMMFPMPIYAPQFPTEFVYPEMTHQPTPEHLTPEHQF